MSQLVSNKSQINFRKYSRVFSTANSYLSDRTIILPPLIASHSWVLLVYARNEEELNLVEESALPFHNLTVAVPRDLIPKRQNDVSPYQEFINEFIAYFDKPITSKATYQVYIRTQNDSDKAREVLEALSASKSQSINVSDVNKIVPQIEAKVYPTDLLKAAMFKDYRYKPLPLLYAEQLNTLTPLQSFSSLKKAISKVLTIKVDYLSGVTLSTDGTRYEQYIKTCLDIYTILYAYNTINNSSPSTLIVDLVGIKERNLSNDSLYR